MTERNTEKFFAPCPRGLEQLLGGEIAALGATNIVPAEGGVGFSGTLATAYAANLHSRIASRILWQVGTGRYRNEEAIYRGVHALDWNAYFDPILTIRVNVASVGSPLTSLEFITLKIKDAACDKFREQTGKRPSVDTAEPDVRIHAFLERERYTLYLDTSGNPLFKRGSKLMAGEAPLRENLAAGILMLCGWTPEQPLLDPMCGSGTILIEAAQISRGIPPGYKREFAFQKLKNFDAGAWKRLSTEAEAGIKATAPAGIFGGDLYGEALKLARTNLEAAGLADSVSLKQVNILEIAAPAESGVLVTNPPYGVRLGELDELAAFYPKLGDVLKQKFAGWRAYLFTADMRVPKLIGLSPSKRTPLFNGPLECRLYEFKMVSGAMRREKQGLGEVQGLGSRRENGDRKG